MNDRRLADDVDHAQARIERGVAGPGRSSAACNCRSRAAAPSSRDRAARLARDARLPTSARSPTTMRPSVDLPQPDSPTSPTTSPSAIARSTRSTACTTSSCRPAPAKLAMRAATSSGLHEALRDALAARAAAQSNRRAALMALLPAAARDGSSAACVRRRRTAASRGVCSHSTVARAQRGGTRSRSARSSERRRHAAESAASVSAGRVAPGTESSSPRV